MINILVPMGGLGKRFLQSGQYSWPKPLIEVPLKNGKTGPMIELVVQNLNLNGRYIFLVSREHYNKYAFNYLLPLITRPYDCEIVIEDPPISGCASACLLAKHLINNDDNLIVANSDQWINYDSDNFLKSVKNVDGAILTFYGTHPKWSFSKVDETTGFITEVAEKKPISTNANTGVYYWNKGSDFISSVEEMVADDFRINNEFYVAPSFNYLINKGKKILNYPVTEMHGLGTPEDLQKFLHLNINK